MADLTAKELAAKLRGERFKHSETEIAKLSDPVADTAMVVKLDELRPYELNPRIVRNPRYDDIKASIRERGLEAPPPITRRPGESHYIIRNGGNTRLSILQELWTETKEERFFRIPCLFRPWSARGEILALTGHLAENELRGALTFIERALGVDKARELYEREAGKAITQTELSKRLTQDGYPVAQSHISRMQDAIRYLLPSIPKILFAGLGKHQIERLITLRRSSQRIFDRHAAKNSLSIDFHGLFHDISSVFDLAPATFNVQRLQDELIGQMATLLGANYDALTLALEDAETLLQSWPREPSAGHSAAPTSASVAPGPATPEPPQQLPRSAAGSPPPNAEPSPPVPSMKDGSVECQAVAPATAVRSASREAPSSTARRTEQIQEPASQATTTDHVQAIQQRIATAPAHLTPPQVSPADVPQVAPARESGQHSASRVWHVEASYDEPARLREHIGRLAREIAAEANVPASCIEPIEEGIGFVSHGHTAGTSAADPPADAVRRRAVLSLLASLSAAYVPRPPAVDSVRLIDDLAPLLQGVFRTQRTYSPEARLSDGALIKLFQLIRLARTLVDLESTAAGGADPHIDAIRA